ncbi:uncharacterized protein LOC112575467 isoform X2 [Pomacea canaliculata]|uniref:uncharacterized protein LOC112575467 isoform X2 n=1 Tax=Pomacea canaliculata TaxID=400727 RepID=UPI000D7367AB|nr:uncharacterized protein LOC112575467 isoform X2 [Pomacea canaliculata]
MGSRAACSMLYHLLLQTVKTQQSAGVSPGQPHLLQYHLHDDKDEEKTVNELSQISSGGLLYVIADEAVSDYREVEQDVWIFTRRSPVQPYSERGVPDHTDGPPVRRVYHRGEDHSGRRPGDCVTCGREVASFLHSLRVGVRESGTTTSTAVNSTSEETSPPCLQWRDVLVLDWGDITESSGMVTGLQEAGIPVRVMKDDDIEDVATARSDVVWVADGRHVRGLERKVVVCLDGPAIDLVRSGFRVLSISDISRESDRRSSRFDLMSRCTSQLVIVSHEND